MDEARQLSASILYIVNHGGTREVGPVGRRSRWYRLSRQTDGLSVRTGAGRILLPLTSAVRLAGMLRGNRGAAATGACA